MIVLVDVVCVNGKFLFYYLGFLIGLWINVGGWIGDVVFGVCLLMIDDVYEVIVIVECLD